MLVVAALILALGWAWLRGGRLTYLTSFPLRGWGLALGAVGIQAVVIYLPTPAPTLPWLRAAFLIFSYALLAGFVWWNRRLPGIWILGIGMLANWIVILANGGHMPITYDALVAAGKSDLVTRPLAGTYVFGSKDILLAREETRLWFLSDIFVIPPPLPIRSVFSIGDVLIALGLFRLLPAALGAPAREQRLASRIRCEENYE